MALCDALGFEVERTVDYKEQSEDIANVSLLSAAQGTPRDNSRILLTETVSQNFIRTECGGYMSKLIRPIIDYKLTKKPNST